MTDSAVRAEELTRAFGDFVAVDHVSFRVSRGEIFGFLGPNGAGKTTTIRMLTGLLRPTSGRGSVAGIDIAADARALRSRIGYMSQSFSLYGDLSVLENIDLVGGLYDVSGERFRQRRDWVVAMAGLRGREQHLAAELPLGFKQRLALGCAVLHEPPVLFLDEPTSGVDPLARRAFWDLIRELAGAGTTVLVSTHYMEEAEYCDRLILMNRGRLIAEGAPAALRRLTAEPVYSVETTNAALAVQALSASPRVVDAAMFGRAVHVTMEDAEGAADLIANALRSSGQEADSIREIEPSLEDVFVSLVRREGGAVEG